MTLYFEFYIFKTDTIDIYNKTNTSTRGILLLYLVAFGLLNLRAQVTIGSDEAPEKAALLQIKDKKGATVGGATAETGGLLMPRVELEDDSRLLPFFSTEDIMKP